MGGYAPKATRCEEAMRKGWCREHNNPFPCVDAKNEEIAILRRMVLKGPCMPMLSGPDRDEQEATWLDEKIAIARRGGDPR